MGIVTFLVIAKPKRKERRENELNLKVKQAQFPSRGIAQQLNAIP